MKNKGEKKILFLDFDGVLNSIAYFLTTPKTVDMFLEVKQTFKSNLDPHNVKIINYILEQVPELEIIISSSWGAVYRLPEIRKGLKYAGLKKEFAKRIIDITPRKMSSYRCNEVKWAIDDLKEEGWKCEKWLTLDDTHIFPDHLGKEDVYGQYVDREIRTNKMTGVQIGDAWQIIKYFRPDFKYPEVLI
jgi:hypothetical protein